MHFLVIIDIFGHIKSKIIPNNRYNCYIIRLLQFLLRICKVYQFVILSMKISPIFDQMSDQHTRQMLKNQSNSMSLMLPMHYCEIMDSNLIHFCKGSVVIGNSIKKPLASFIGILVLQTMFATCICIVRDKEYITPVALTITTSIICCFLFIQTLLADPGVLPKEYFNSGYNLLRIPKNRYLFQTVLVSTTGNRTVDIKLCPQCLIFRSADTYHCRQCNVCIIGHDHHCAWMGKCIGRHNYKYFFLFLFVLTLMVLTQLSYSVETAVLHPSSKYLPWVIVNIFQEGTIGGYITQLFIFHLVLVYNGQTTKQHIKQRDTRHQSKSLKNFYQILTGSYSPYYHPDKILTPNMLRIVHDQWELNTLENKNLPEEEEGEIKSEKQYTGQDVSVEREL